MCIPPGKILGTPLLHGLIPGLNWAPFWPLPMSMHLVAMPGPVSCFLLQRVGFHTLRLLLSGWLLTNVQVNITTMLHGICAHMYSSHQHYYSSLLPTHLPFFLAGWLTPTHRVGYKYIYLIKAWSGYFRWIRARQKGPNPTVSRSPALIAAYMYRFFRISMQSLVI